MLRKSLQSSRSRRGRSTYDHLAKSPQDQAQAEEELERICLGLQIHPVQKQA